MDLIVYACSGQSIPESRTDQHVPRVGGLSVPSVHLSHSGSISA